MKFRFPIVIEKEDDMYVAHCPTVGVTSQGKTVEDAIKNLKEAVELYIEYADKEEINYLKKFATKEIITATITI